MSELREKILATSDKVSTPVHIPEWDVTLCMRGMTVGELQSFERNAKAFQEKGDVPPNFRESIAAQYLEDERGERIFESGDVAALAKKSAKPMQRILEAFLEVNGLNEEDLDELEGN